MIDEYFGWVLEYEGGGGNMRRDDVGKRKRKRGVVNRGVFVDIRV